MVVSSSCHDDTEITPHIWSLIMLCTSLVEYAQGRKNQQRNNHHRNNAATLRNHTGGVRIDTIIP